MKSQASDLLEVAYCIYKDAYAKCTAVNVDARDLQTYRSRLEHEGLSFLTITLPGLGLEFERSLALGQIEPCAFRSFKKASKGGRIPAFLQGIFAQVFDQTTGRLHDEPSIAAIEGIRQLAYAFKKLLVDCSPDRVESALDGYVECEHDLRVAVAPDDSQEFLAVSDALWGSVFDQDVLDNALPKHGPGTTEERITGNRKFVHRRWHERLEPYFPFLGTAYNISAYGSEEYEKVTLISEDDEHPVRVVTVPKTLKGPRIIAIEPVCMQYTQQMLASSIVRSVERARFSAGHVNFTDQSVNRSLALSSSKTGKFATLDLSSASDRVPRELALAMFRGIPHLRDAIDACRSRRAILPDGSVVHLRKFASMGSALCFPIESMYFYTICVAALLRKHSLPVTSSNIFKVSRMVYVYGDDIVVPADAAGVVTDYLTKYKCKVNTAKSFWTGKFRESCGMDAYDGEEVTPTYLRRTPPCDKRSAESIISWVESSNLFYKKGYWLTSSLLLRKVESLIGVLPITGERCQGLGKLSFQDLPTNGKYRWDARYQRREIRTWVPTPVYRTDRLEGHAALIKCLLALESRGDETTMQSDHLDRTARRGAVVLKRRWVPPE